MPHVDPLALEETSEAKAAIEGLASKTGFIANSMLTLAHRPEIADAVLQLIRATVRNPDGKVDPAIRWMVAHVTSLANGCQYCSAHTFKNGADNGVSDEKLAAIWEFETSPVFTDAERAALRVAVTGGQCPSYATKEDMAELRKHFSQEQIVEIGAVIALFGFNNRWNAFNETDVEGEVTDFLDTKNYSKPNKKLALNGSRP